MRIASYIVVLYMLAALCWWSILLYQKNEIIYQTQVELAMHDATIDLDQLKAHHQRQKAMIFSEGLVFACALIWGISFISRGLVQRVKNAENQKNFLLSISHELKSPIASIKLALETIKKRKLETEKLQKVSDAAIIEVNRLNKLVENLLTANALEHHYDIYMEPCSIDTISEKLNNTKTLYKDRLHIVLKENTTNFSMDLSGFLKIFENLAENAIKYSADRIEAVITYHPENSCLELVMKDYGPGIAEKEKQQVFDRFYRIGNEETRKAKGTGLGLFIVKQIVKANKGQIKLLDNKPQGLIFQIKLPTA